METLRALLSVADFPPFMDGGVAEASERTFEALLQEGIEAQFIAGCPRSATPPSTPLVTYVRTPLYGSPAWRYLAFNAASERAKRRAARDVDVFHSLSGIFGDLGVGRRGRAVHVTTIYNTLRAVYDSLHSFNTDDRRTRRAYYAAMLRLEARLARRSDAVAVSSLATWDDVVENYHVDPRRVHTVHLGVDPRKITPPDQKPTLVPDSRYLLAVSRLVPRKGIEDILDAFHALSMRHEDLCLVLVGRGDAAYEARVVRQTSRLGIESRVVRVSELYPETLAALYHHAELLVTCSRVEGFGLAPAEAMASGLPVVAYDIPGIRDVVADGVSGKLVAAHTPAAMADAIEHLLHDEAAHRKLREGAKEHAKSFSWAATARHLREVYKTALDARAGRT